MLSIIIPVYCVENTLDRCVKSVVGQSYHDIEIILVDDGSPDHCPEMCDSWAQKDGRIRVIHQNNGGLSDARNVGIDASRGEWLTFVDSDDYIEEGTLEQVMAATADNDLVEYPVERFCGSPQESLLTFEPKVYKDMSDYWLNGQAYEHSYVWNKIYRKELFNQIRFPKGQVFEDIQTLPLLLQKAHRVATIPHGLYHYCWNESGITATANGQALESLLNAHLQTPWMDDRYYMRVMNIQIDVYEQLKKEILLPYRSVSIVTKGLRPPERMKALLLRIVGVKGVCQLFYTLHKITRV